VTGGVGMTVLEILNWSTNYLKDHQTENPRLNAELLLCHSLGLSREELYTRFHRPIREGEKATLERLINRRLSGEPLQYILGRQEFWSIDLKVDPRVLIPRPETELLVEQSLSIISKTPFKNLLFVLEIGTGSGAVAISLAKEVREIFLVATDISWEALMLARENAKTSGVLHQIQFVHGSLVAPFRVMKEREPFDLILFNPPYIADSEMEGLAREVRDYEPRIALSGGEDGLAFYRSLISQAPVYLKKRGWLLLELGQFQGEGISELFQNEGDFLKPEFIQDLSGIERVVRAQKK
jgi:release factor glutamine methyltransferase